MNRCLAWDFDGTLAWRPGMWSGALAEAAAEVGCKVDTSYFKPFLQQGFPWHSPEITRPSSVPAEEWWRDLESLFETTLSGCEGVDAHNASKAARSVRRLYCDPGSWRVFDDAVTALEELSAEGWRHVIISNHVPELEAVVRGLDLMEHFETVISSGTTGIEKPHPEAFGLVRSAVGLETEVVMVGDSWWADICGAMSVGLEAVLVRTSHPEARLQCVSLRDLRGILER